MICCCEHNSQIFFTSWKDQLFLYHHYIEFFIRRFFQIFSNVVFAINLQEKLGKNQTLQKLKQNKNSLFSRIAVNLIILTAIPHQRVSLNFVARTDGAIKMTLVSLNLGGCISAHWRI